MVPERKSMGVKIIYGYECKSVPLRALVPTCACSDHTRGLDEVEQPQEKGRRESPAALQKREDLNWRLPSLALTTGYLAPSPLNFWFWGCLQERKKYFFPNSLTVKSAKGRSLPLPQGQAPSHLLERDWSTPFSAFPPASETLSSLSTLSWLLTQVYVLLVGWIISLGLSLLLQRVGFTSSIFSCPKVQCVAYVLP